MKQGKSSVPPAVSAADVAEEMRTAVMEAAGRREWSDTIDLMLWRAAQRLGISHRRARAFWQREAKAITATEYLTVKQRIAALQARIAESEARNEETRKTIRRVRIALAGNRAGEGIGADGTMGERTGAAGRED